ncbi:flagellar hook assembly protein FlgD [Steroidobacter cummioxidans]|uniref:flagellar hook assembly protein FlgD n=1 Tax=Steroidobacter cummioxidans TaxID=1803913 RepID=UPI000E321357|nr:flagellar hook capping FlgD N-terminal domain-containing protein [Steroidobacter cummioxidans]
MTIASDPIQNWAAQAQAAAEAKAKKDQTLGIDSFLTLMTAQLRNQDPLKPLEGTEFISQLAQFGTVSGVQGMQTSLETLAASLRSTQTLNGTTMIGRDILASADHFDHTEGGTVRGQIDVPVGTTSLQLRITDSAGVVVREIQLETEDGTQDFTWDGMRTDGTPAESGTYDIEAVATVRGQTGSLEVLMAGRVSSVSLDASGTNLTLNTPTLGQVSMAAVRRVQ